MTENNLYTQEEKRKIIEYLLKIGHLSGAIEDWIKEDTVSSRAYKMVGPEAMRKIAIQTMKEAT